MKYLGAILGAYIVLFILDPHLWGEWIPLLHLTLSDLKFGIG